MINNLDIVEHTTQYEALKNKGNLLTGVVGVSGTIGAGGRTDFTQAVTLPSGTEFVQARFRKSDESGKLYMADVWNDFFVVPSLVWLTPYIKLTGSIATVAVRAVNQDGSNSYSLGNVDFTFYLRPFVSPF